jgi:uroporphyrinogen-III decarboxylase
MSESGSVTVLGSVSFGWLAAHGEFVFDQAFFMDPRVRLDRERRMHAFVAQRFPLEPIYNIEAHLVQIEGRRRPVALVGALQPNLILGAALGAEFVFYGDKDPDITPTPLAEVRDLDPLWNIDWSGTHPVSLFLEQIGQMREAMGGRVPIIPPFFWDTTGRATTHGIVTTAQKLMGERIFLEMADSPRFAHEFLSWIVDAYVKLIHLFARAAGMSITGLHTGDCSVCMIGPEQFVEFVLPRLNEFSERVGPLRLHSCGLSDHLLEVFAQVRNLASLNVGSNTSVAKIRERFGRIRIDLIPDLELLMFGKPADVDAWVRRGIEENAGGELEFQYHLDYGQPEANCLQINRTLAAMGMGSERVTIY